VTATKALVACCCFAHILFDACFGQFLCKVEMGMDIVAGYRSSITVGDCTANKSIPADYASLTVNPI
jgi:hypothetical protein